MKVTKQIIEVDVFRDRKISQFSAIAFTGLLRPIIILSSVPDHLDAGLNFDYVAPACAYKLKLPIERTIFVLYKDAEYSVADLPRIILDYWGVPYAGAAYLNWRILPEHLKKVVERGIDLAE